MRILVGYQVVIVRPIVDDAGRGGRGDRPIHAS